MENPTLGVVTTSFEDSTVIIEGPGGRATIPEDRYYEMLATQSGIAILTQLTAHLASQA